MKLFLQNQQTIEGTSFGADTPSEGEVVFTTGMTGYLEVLTDPSYYGQIVVFTYPLIGNYGVFDPKEFAKKVDQTYESEKIWVRGVIITEDSKEFSHELGIKSFSDWLKAEGIPALSGVDTRELTQELREHGTLFGNLGEEYKEVTDEELVSGRFVPSVSPKEVSIIEPENPIGKTIAFIDCGAKNGILRNFLKRGIRIIRCPFDQNPFELDEKFDGVFLSNGPGDPATLPETIAIAKDCLDKAIPTFGICLGNQILGLAAGAKTIKMKYGHRGVNQPVQNQETEHCMVTTQNHGYVIDEDSIPSDFMPLYKNLNDGSIEGIKHKTKPLFSVQFHPEACAGPEDAQPLFDDFIATL